MTATELASMLADRAEEVCRHLLPNGNRRGRDWCCGSLSGEPGGSLKISLSGSKVGVWADFADNGSSGDLIGLWQRVRGIDLAHACRQAESFLGVNGTTLPPVTKRIETKAPSETWVRLQEKIRAGTDEELDALAELRGLPSVAGLQLATTAGHLWFADVWDDGFDRPSWIVTDGSRRNAQARRMDGQLWSGINAKAKTIAGCEAAWPIGAHESGGMDIALVEGGPDLLAAWHCIAVGGHRNITPIAMLGASQSIHPDALPLLGGRHIFLFPHGDAAGKKATEKWSNALSSSTTQTVSLPTKDLNDFVASGADISGVFTKQIELMDLDDDTATEKTRQQQNLDRLSPLPDAPASDAFEPYRITLSSNPSEPTTRLFLAGKPIATPGNLVSIISRAKTGKTATIGGVVAAIIGAHFDRYQIDTLGFTAPHTKEAVVLIDTEQSPYDAFICHQRAFARASQPTDVDWFHHYALVGKTAKELKEMLPGIMARAKAKHGDVFTLIIDGVADLVESVNDEAECNNLITWLRAIAVEYNCPIICVIHSNEAQKSGDDGRGHLGKQLTRKSESNLLLKKTGEVTVITSEKQRKAPITEADGIAFQWSEEHGRHMLTKSIPESKSTAGRKTKYDGQKMLSCLPGPTEKPATLGAIMRIVGQLPCSISDRQFKDYVAKWLETGEAERHGDVKMGFTFRRTF